MQKHYSQLFNMPTIDYPILNSDLNFNDYIAQTQKIIRQTRLDLSENTEKILNANSPFELRPKEPTRKIGALLIHGLFDSPLILRDIGEHLQKEGLLVRAILLPGHGTIPAGLLNINYQQWLEVIRYGITTLAKEVDQIILVGFSTGAILALHQVIHDQANIAGLILLSPALKLQQKFAFASNWHRYISWAWPRAAWFHINKDEMIDYAKYQSVTFNSAYQIYRLTQDIKKINSPPRPLFFALSQDDTTVCSQGAIHYFQKHACQRSQLLLYSNSKDDYNDSRILVKPSAYPEMHIVNFSHNAIPISPNNPHYGIHGDYPYASHIDEDTNIFYGEFNPLSLKFKKLLYKLKLTPYQYHRLTFNPDFSYLCSAISRFIQKIG